MPDSTPDPLLELAEALTDGSPLPPSPDEPTRRAFAHLARIAEVYRTVSPLEAPADAEAPTLPAELTQWGPLSLRGRLGSGSFGEVYRAYDPRLDREVALKLRRPDADARASARHFVSEARRMARVRHPHVESIFGVATHEGRVGLWCELIRGETLEQWLSRHGTLSAREAAAIGADLCGALAAVHHAGLVHGDVTTRNVMREEGGRIVLMDFGAASERRPVWGDGPAFVRFGTPVSTAPELLRGESPSPASDIYAVGLLLYRLVTRRYPREAPAGLEGSGATAPPLVPLLDVRPDLPAAFADVIERALADDPRDRPHSAGDLGRTLARAVGATADGPAPARRPARWFAFGVLAVAACAAAGFALWARTRPAAERAVATAPAPHAGPARSAAASPAMSAPPAFAMHPTLFAARTATAAGRPVTAGAPVPAGAALSLQLLPTADAEVYVLCGDTAEPAYALTTSAPERVRADALASLPRRGHWVLDSPRGRVDIALVAFRAPQPWMRGLLADVADERALNATRGVHFVEGAPVSGSTRYTLEGVLEMIRRRAAAAGVAAGDLEITRLPLTVR